MEPSVDPPRQLKSGTATLVTACAGMLLSFATLVADIVGPPSAALLGIPTFILTAVTIAMAQRIPANHLVKRRVPLWFSISAGLVVATWLMSIPVACLAAGPGGVADTPALAIRPRYELINHGAVTVVSRRRYILNSASSSLVWTGLLALANISAVLRTRYGRTLFMGGPSVSRSEFKANAAAHPWVFQGKPKATHPRDLADDSEFGLYDIETGLAVGSVSGRDLKFLISHDPFFRRNDFYMGTNSIDMLRSEGLPPATEQLLRDMLGDRRTMHLRWY